MDLELIQTQFRVPIEYRLEILDHSGRICESPPGQLGLYEESFKAGLRLLHHSFFCSFFPFSKHGLDFGFAKLIVVHLGLYNHFFSCQCSTNNLTLLRLASPLKDTISSRIGGTFLLDEGSTSFKELLPLFIV